MNHNLTKSASIRVIGCVDPILFPYPFDKRRTLNHFMLGEKIIILDNLEHTPVYYHVVSTRLFERQMNHSFLKTISYCSDQQYISKIVKHWFGGQEQNVSVFFYLTEVQVPYDDSLATTAMLRAFKHRTENLLKECIWIPTGDHRTIVLKNNKPSYITWLFDSLIEYKKDSFFKEKKVFIRKWNLWLKRSNDMIQHKQWYMRDAKELKGLKWNDLQINRKFRLVCEQAVYLEPGEFQDWTKQYLAHIALELNKDCGASFSISINSQEGILFKNETTGEIVDNYLAIQSIKNQLEKNNECQMIPIHLSFFSHDFTEGHMVMMFLDHLQNTALVFDPNGEDFDVWTSVIGQEDFEELFIQMNQLFADNGYRIVQSRNICLNREQNFSRRCVNILSNGGYCMWISYFAMIIALLTKSSPPKVIQTIEQMDKNQREIVLETFIGWIITKYDRSNQNWKKQTFHQKIKNASQTIEMLLNNPQRQHRMSQYHSLP